MSQVEYFLTDELCPFTLTNMIDMFGFNCDKIFYNYVYFLYLLYFVYSFIYDFWYLGRFMFLF